MRDGRVTGDVRHVVEIAVRVRCRLIDRRRQNPGSDAPESQKAASSAPAAPSKCPVIDFVELIGT